jgi:hypothetical protein
MKKVKKRFSIQKTETNYKITQKEEETDSFFSEEGQQVLPKNDSMTRT